MLINRTYRTWVYDYRSNYGLSKKTTHTHKIPICPNSINSFNTDIVISGNFIADSYAVININTKNRKNYIELYEGNTTGILTDQFNPLYGDLASIGTNVTSNGFLKISINGSHYYIRKYIGPTLTGCCSYMFGNEVQDSLGNFVIYGFMAIEVSNAKKFIKVYTLQ